MHRFFRLSRAALYLAALTVALLRPAEASPANSLPTAWTASALNNPVAVYAGPGFYYTDPLFVRAGQQPVRFDLGNSGANEAKVRVDNGPWTSLGSGIPYIWWTNPPTQVGQYNVTFTYVGPGAANGITTNYTLTVVPAATARYTDGSGNSMVFWKGGSSEIDSPFLMVEGIDAANKNSANTYYALAMDLFNQSRQRNADVYLLDFNDGGRDLRENATVVESAIDFLNASRRSATGRFDVAGVSMGGVVARIALARMEAAGRPHRAGRFISMDAPQHKAVIQHSLADFIKAQSDAGRVAAPANLTSVAGRQLLEYNPYASPGQSTQFFSEIDQINGTGYPHQTQNLGVSFGTMANNPYGGQRWLRYQERTYFGAVVRTQDFNVTNDVATPGSYLPLDVTNVWGYACAAPGACGVGELLRFTPQPTFIPTASALHIVNGQSRFAETMTAATASHHDRVPLELQTRIINWLYPPPPLSVSISGPGTYTPSVPTTWTAGVSGGTPSYTYSWKYKYECYPSPPPPCTGRWCEALLPNVPAEDERRSGLRGPQCDVWESVPAGASATIALSGNVPAAILQVTVTDGAGGVDFATFRTVPGAQAAAGEATGGGTGAAAGAYSVAGDALPSALALEAIYPNPSSAAAGVTLAVPEASDVAFGLYDVTGREVWSHAPGRLGPGRHHVPLGVSGLTPGTYVLRVTAGDAVVVRRLTVVD